MSRNYSGPRAIGGYFSHGPYLAISCRRVVLYKGCSEVKSFGLLGLGLLIGILYMASARAAEPSSEGASSSTGPRIETCDVLLLAGSKDGETEASTRQKIVEDLSAIAKSTETQHGLHVEFGDGVIEAIFGRISGETSLDQILFKIILEPMMNVIAQIQAAKVNLRDTRVRVEIEEATSQWKITSGPLAPKRFEFDLSEAKATNPISNPESEIDRKVKALHLSAMVIARTYLLGNPGAFANMGGEYGEIDFPNTSDQFKSLTKSSLRSHVVANIAYYFAPQEADHVVFREQTLGTDHFYPKAKDTIKPLMDALGFMGDENLNLDAKKLALKWIDGQRDFLAAMTQALLIKSELSQTDLQELFNRHWRNQRDLSPLVDPNQKLDDFLKSPSGNFPGYL